MAASYARETDMLSGHGSYPAHPFPEGGSLALASYIEGKKILTVDSIDTAHPGSPSPNSPIPTAKVVSGSPTCFTLCKDGQMRAVARIGDVLDCGCMILGGGNTVGGGTGG
jgi:hypothetical protein|tara:strand:+ start:84 stop:416 length:333 start_codon:yes stop_codon:yes gene_type:complete